MNDALLTIALFVGGVLLLALFAWSWRGTTPRARWWHRDARGSDSMAMGFIPGAGVVLVAASAYRVLPDALSPIAVFVIVAGVFGGVLGAVVPRLWGPPWYRDYLARRKRAARKR
ncbi:hypothetical protein [Solicola gregarius]|uniref:Uncharacterized protein n=1 Tax=Solicola gregarius TaxID=2908642 RepID=A0AA46YNM2_9ACTN|nr:hypothetical protein [Solicola gregarius]UYM07769.1 hypothetical protein L0C25_12080 [Solicola gregarius]